MSDDFRVRVTLADRRQAAQLGGLLERGEITFEDGAGGAGRVAASVDDREVFLYLEERSQADAAAAALRDACERHGWSVEVELRRWHPVAEEWADVDAPVPTTGAEEDAERARLIAQERSESASWGFSEYEVRIQCPSHRDTVELSRRLLDEGLPAVRRWRYLLVGVPDEDSAQTLADRLRGEVPAGSTITVEASLAAIARQTPPNPFAVFGGLGG